MYSSTTCSVGPDDRIRPLSSQIDTGQSLHDRVHVVADEEHRSSALLHLIHLPEAATLELDVADGEDLVHEQDVRRHVGGDGESEPQIHARRVALDRRVHEALQPGELDDLVEPGVHLLPGHAEDRAVQVGVLEARQLAVEAGADLEQ